MFEKESQDYAMREVAPRQELYIKGRADIDADYEKVKKIWQEGAEFGYNKAKNEVITEATKNYNAIIAEYEKHYKERIAELEKANEWHYVKDGDYPKDNKPVLCILGDIDSDNCEVGYYNDVESGEPWHFETYHLPDDDGDNAWGVIAWKEIVLPKESE
jgi:hypothetical protein